MIEALLCLALNVYFEARGDDVLSQVATSQVEINRVKDTRYPNQVCDVFFQSEKHENGFPKKNRCQFSWYCDGKSDQPTDKKAWKQSQAVAKLVLNGQIADLTGGATHYHAFWVQPVWRIKKTFTGRIGDHLFFRWEK